MISFKSIIGRKDKADQPESDAQKKKESIFGKTLVAGQMVKAKKAKYLEEKNKKMAYAKLGGSLMVLLLYSVFFFYSNTVAYLKAPAQIAQLQEEIQEYEDVIIPDLEKTRDLHKSAYDEEHAEVLKALDDIFPAEIDKLGMIQLFESFATEVAAAYPPFEFTSISLSQPQEKDGYLVIPVSTSIYSSLAGFDRFLSLVDRSGYVYTGEGEDKTVVSKKIRLMNISNISINYRGVDEKTGENLGVDFSVKLNVYSRIPQKTRN
ncbi:hypothetical protein JXD20_01760 [Candidatus Peregrinibacteria bacterium]|nr:hypothetical protein [Candidatus Peregrinibacteria bacterium]